MIGMIVSLVAMFYLFDQIKATNFTAAISGFSIEYFIPCTICLALAYVLRILRWSMLLSGGSKEIGFSKCVTPFMASIAINNVLPLRLGDILRAVVFPRSISVEPLVSAGTIIYEKLLDVFVLLTFVCLYAFVDQDILKLITSQYGLIFIITLLVIMSLLLFKKRFSLADFNTFLNGLDSALLQAFGNALIVIFQHIKHLSSAVIVTRLMLISALSWLFEGGTYFFVLEELKIDISVPELLFITAMTTFATLVPSSPGYLGTFHVAAFSVATLIGIETTDAAAFAIISHLCLWLPTTLAGFVSVIFNPKIFYLTREYTINEK